MQTKDKGRTPMKMPCPVDGFALWMPPVEAGAAGLPDEMQPVLSHPLDERVDFAGHHAALGGQHQRHRLALVDPDHLGVIDATATTD